MHLPWQTRRSYRSSGRSLYGSRTPILLTVNRELETLDRDSHLFCEDSSRRDLAIDCLQLFAYDGPDALPWHDELASRTARCLQKCDKCIIQYYKAKRKWVEGLRSVYNDEDVELFAQIIDGRDFERIQNGLKEAVSTLRPLPPERQRQNALAASSIYSLFEALACESFLDRNGLLDVHFN